MSDRITNDEDIIDSRQVIDRISELQGLIHSCETPAYEVDDDDRAELAALEALASAGSDFFDWEHGVTLIRDSYFESYAREFADDIGAIDLNASWPLSCIDWGQAADELRQDYSAIDFDGVTYWAR